MELLERIFDKEGNLTIDFDNVESISELSGYISSLKNVGYHSLWHNEGSAWQHTINVVNAMYNIIPYDKENDDCDTKLRRMILVAAAFFHDFGKALVGECKENGDWSFPFHAPEGERLVRTLLWDEDFEIREMICELVGNHMKAYYIMDNKEKLIELAEENVSLDELFCLKDADCKGAVQKEYDGHNEYLSRHRAMALELDCLHNPYCFTDSNERFRTFNKGFDNLKDDEDFTVYFMIGLPGSGKDTFIQMYYHDLPVVCRDVERDKLMGDEGVKKVGNNEQENKITEICNAKIVEYAENGQSFVINQTNLQKKYRDALKNLLKPYNVRIEYIYVEAPSFQDNLSRRNGMIKPHIIENMRKRFEFPKAKECHSITYYKSVGYKGEPWFKRQFNTKCFK